MNQTRRAMLAAARATHDVLTVSEVEARWGEPSALEGFSVGGLASHVTTVLATCLRAIDDPEASGDLVPAEEYYSTLRLADTNDDAAAQVVAHGEERSRHGATATAGRFSDLLTTLTERLEDVPEGRRAQIFGLLPMRLDDFFVTRALEFWVHSDDLACSVGVATPDVGQECRDLVLTHLYAVARHRHGDVAVLRAFTRRERDAVDALRVF